MMIETVNIILAALRFSLASDSVLVRTVKQYKQNIRIAKKIFFKLNHFNIIPSFVLKSKEYSDTIAFKVQFPIKT